MRMIQYPLRNHICYFREILGRRPDACAFMYGSDQYPDICGTVAFYRTIYGVLVVSDISNLPGAAAADACDNRIFAFHIHEGRCCTGNSADPFADTGGHYNPYGCEHPHHAGDMPPLFSNHGYAFSAFLTDRFNLPDIIGHTVIIHEHVDDFTSQPAGNAGAKIACGVIQ